jgi:acyl-CoA thioesterase-2
VFGGQTIAQALVAAQRTVEPDDRHVHSLHGYFMLGGDTTVPIVYEVDRIRDGGSFTTRASSAIQHGEAIFSLEASFQLDEPGLEHQSRRRWTCRSRKTLPRSAGTARARRRHVPEAVRRYWERERPIEIKPGQRSSTIPAAKSCRRNRTSGCARPETVPADRAAAALLAYMSDMTLLDTSTFAHGRAIFDPDLQVASLDHAMWFHRTIRSTAGCSMRRTAPPPSGAAAASRAALIYAPTAR